MGCFPFLALAGLLLALPLPGHSQSTSGIHVEAITLHEFGSDEAAILALPVQPPQAAALLMPDALGSREVVEQRSVLLARLGYLTLALDFYNGQEASDPAEAARLAQRVDAARASQAIESALRLLLDSPRYRCPRVFVCVWDAHVVHLAQALDQSPDRAASIPLLTVIEAGDASLRLLHGRQWPVQYIMRTAMAASEKPAEVSAGMLAYNLFDAPAGFMLDASDCPAAVEAWSLMLDAWNRRLEGQPLAETPTPMPSPRSDPSPSTPPSRPPARPLHPRLVR